MNAQKVLFTSLFVIALLTSLNAQSFKKGSFNLQLGVGALPTYFMDGGETEVPPMSINVDYKLGKLFSVGAFGAYSDSKSQITSLQDGSAHQWHNKTKQFGIRAAAHASNFDRIDFYGGVQLAYSMPDVEHIVLIPGEERLPVSKVKNALMYTGFVGMTGYLTENIGLFGEFGYDISLLKVGITAKM